MIKIVILICLILIDITVFVLNYDFGKLKEREEYLKSANEKVRNIEQLNILISGEIDNQKLDKLYSELSLMEELEESEDEPFEIRQKYREIIDIAWELSEDVETGNEASSKLKAGNEKLQVLNKTENEFIALVNKHEQELNKKIISLSLINEFKYI